MASRTLNFADMYPLSTNKWHRSTRLVVPDGPLRCFWRFSYLAAPEQAEESFMSEQVLNIRAYQERDEEAVVEL